ncbi:hypothetical protein D3C78_1679510 [compost metagenome]
MDSGDYRQRIMEGSTVHEEVAAPVEVEIILQTLLHKPDHRLNCLRSLQLQQLQMAAGNPRAEGDIQPDHRERQSCGKHPVRRLRVSPQISFGHRRHIPRGKYRSAHNHHPL